MSSLPDFDSLPSVEGQPQGNAWGLWGKDDELGTLNLLTEKTILEARSEIQTGHHVSLDLPLDHFKVQIAMRQNFQQDIVDFSRLFKGTPGEKYGHDDVLHFNTQASSQWDGLRHVGLQIQGGLYYNGMKHEDIDSKKTLRNGIHKWIENGGIVGRGILLDYVRWRQETGQPAADPTSTHSITVPELEQVAKHQGLEFKPGDILIVRSGYTLWHGNADEDEQAKVLGRGSFIGVEPSLRTLKWLWNHHFAAVAGDTIGFESAPIDWEEGGIALHNWLIDHWGSPIGELFNLEPLSALCAEHKRWSFFLTSHPLYSPGGVASPPNAIAIM